ncbi:MAG: hypothetical protein N2560_06175 [Ignavibacteria bacterium]|nr:hypothetical protein [Ignavibacteria bacterium]
MSRNQNKFAYLVAVVLLLAFAISDIFAQDFTNNTGGTYQVGTGGGTIRMRSSGGKFNGTAPYGTQTNPVPGTVIWYCDNNMNVGGLHDGTNYLPTYYTNLGTNGNGIKTFLEDFFVSGTYQPLGGNRNYTANSVVVTYNGTSGNQVIAGEYGGNGTGYYSLVLTGASTKEIATGTTASVASAFSLSSSSGAMTNNGTFNLNNTQASTADANITNNGTWNFSGTGTFASTADFTNNSGGAGGGVYVNTGAGNVTFNNYSNQSGAFQLAAGTTVFLNGTFTHTGGTITFDCASNFHYSGAAQTIVGNGANFASYGNLFLVGTGPKTAGGNVNVCNNLSVSQEVDMAPGANDYILSMLNTNGSGTASYTGNVEVRGKFRWNNMSNNTSYTFNNANTQVTFSTVPTWFQLDIRQQTVPTNLNNFSNSTDIRRSITANFSGTGTISSLRIYYEDTDKDGSFNPAAENLLRFAEGYNSGQPHQKIVRGGNIYTRNISSPPKNILYAGGNGNGINLIASPGGGTVNELSDGSNIILTGTPLTIVSITNGRWTNPATWDVGYVPSAVDEVEIRHIVWTGIDQAVFGGSAWADDEVDGSTPGDAGAAANSITIANVSGAALIIGNQDPTMGTGERIFRTRLNDVNGFLNAGIYNLNVNANTGDGDGNSASNLQGIWVRPTGQFTPVLGGLRLTNNGSIMNKSIIEIGICQ